MLKVKCPRCRREIEISEDKLGEVAFCEFCRAAFVTERVRAGERPSEPSDPGCVPEKEAVSFVFSSMSGDFKEIEYGGSFFSQEAILRLNRRFCVFTVLLLFQLACLITIVNGVIHGIDSEIPAVSCLMIVLTFVPLSVVYALFLRAMQVSGCRYKLSLSAFWLIPTMLVVCGTMLGNSAFVSGVIMVILMLINIILFLSNMVKAAAILKAAKDLPFRGNRFVRTMKCCSFLYWPLLFSLLVSFFFLGSVKWASAFCPNCATCIDTKTVCFLGVPLLTFSQETPTRDTESLDPEHQCRHRIGNPSSSSSRDRLDDLDAEEYYSLRPVIHDILLMRKTQDRSRHRFDEISHY